LAGACYVKDSYTQKKAPLTNYAHDMADSFYSYEFPNFPTFQASLHIKALSTAITRSIFAQKTENFKGIQVGESQADFDKMNKSLKQAGFTFTMDHKTTKFYSAQAKFSKETSTMKYWLLNFVHSKKFKPVTMFNEAKKIGASLLRKGDTVSFTLVYTTDSKGYDSSTPLNAYLETLKEPLGLKGHKADDGNKARFDMRDKIQKDGQDCGESLTQSRVAAYKRRRPAFTPYRILTEMKLMRRYPNIVYQWL